jgi:hypothetical protein
MFYPSLIGGAAASSAQARAAETTAEDARRKATGLEGKIEAVKYDIERLLMITEAFWTLLKEQHGYTDADLAKLIAEIDIRDGRLDGRVAASPPSPCPYCGHTLTRKRPFCIYCGQPVAPDPFER